MSVKENTTTWKSGRLNTSFALAPYCAVEGINPILILIFLVGKIEVIYGCSLKIKEHGNVIILASITEVSNFRKLQQKKKKGKLFLTSLPQSHQIFPKFILSEKKIKLIELVSDTILAL